MIGKIKWFPTFNILEYVCYASVETMFIAVRALQVTDMQRPRDYSVYIYTQGWVQQISDG